MKLLNPPNSEISVKYKDVNRDKSVSCVCFNRLPGGIARCNLHKGHSGPHVAKAGFWIFKMVTAVWDDDRSTD